MNVSNPPSVALISEFPPPAAGMTVLAEEFYERLKKINYPIIKIRTNPDLGKYSWLNNIRVVRSVVKWMIFFVDCFKIKNTDIIHIFSSSGLNFFLFTIPPIILANLFSKRIIINYHGGAAYDFFSKHQKILAFAMKRINKLVVPSGYLKSVFDEFGYDSMVISNIANVKRFTYRKRIKLEPVVLSVRNLTSVYNIQCAVRAFHILKTKYPHAKMYIAGDGPEMNNIQDLISELKLTDVELLGNISNDQVPVYFNLADIFINTSNIDNMPGSILEAFSSGLPVVSTNVGGIPYMVKHNESGLLADPNDHGTLGKYLIQMVEYPEKSLNMSEAGYSYVLGLKWSKIKNDWLHLYNEL